MGSKLIGQIAKDLKNEFPDIEGFSRTNLFSMRQFYAFYLNALPQNLALPIVHQLGEQLHPDSILMKIPWRHYVLIISKTKDYEEAIFYVKKTMENGWSRSVLEHQIGSNLFQRQGKAITNFKNTLPDVSSDLAQELLKDPYNFDFLTLTTHYKELELEDALVQNITKFLLELGSGFAYVGKQVPMIIGDQTYFIDLIILSFKTKVLCRDRAQGH